VVLIGVAIENLKLTLCWLEPLFHSRIIFQNRCERAFRVRIELLDLVEALSEAAE